MKLEKKGRVVFCQAPDSSIGLEYGAAFARMLAAAVTDLVRQLPSGAPEAWSLKIPLTAPGTPAAVLPAWVGAVKTGLESSGAHLGTIFDNLSITLAGLDTREGLLEQAREQGLAAGFAVGDDPDQGKGLALNFSPESSLGQMNLSGVASAAHGLFLLNSVRPHAHLGMSGVLFNLGCGLLDREAKLLLHRDVRPRVDTPLCAGCGSCLATCIFDAIGIKAGRAFIDHKLCTGCGQCMTACHLAGISPQEASRIPRFQKQVAEVGFAVARQSQAGKNKALLHANVMTPVNRNSAGAFGRTRQYPDVKGVLLSADPVALDQATWDLLVAGAVHGMRQWSGFLQDPGPLLEQAQELGTGQRSYDLQVMA